jgi:hypothetical protein
MQSLKMTFTIFGGSVLVILIVSKFSCEYVAGTRKTHTGYTHTDVLQLAVPPWPYLNRFPVAWTDAESEESKKKQ